MHHTMHNNANNVPDRARHQDEFPTLDNATEIPPISPTTIRCWPHSATGPNLFALKPAREQTRTGLAA